MAKKSKAKRQKLGGKPKTALKPKASTTTPKASPKKILPPFEGFEAKESVYLIVTAVIAIAYYLFSIENQGFHMHDGVSHYVRIKSFWYDPWSVMNLWAKPGYKILFSLLGFLSKPAIIFLHCAMVAIAAYVTGLIVKELGYKQGRFLAMAFVAFQPIVWQTAFRFHSENFVIMLIAFFLLAYTRKKYILAALLISYAMVTRFELGLIAGSTGLIFLYNKRWIPALLIGTFPFVLNLVGFLKTGKPLYFLTDMIGQGDNFKEYTQFGFWYNWKMFSPVIGFVTTCFALVGFLAIGKGWQHTKEHIQKFHIFYLSIFTVFIFYCLITSPWFTMFKLQAQDQSFVQFASAVAVMATVGFYRLVGSDKKIRRGAWITMAGFAAVVFLVHQYLYVHPNEFWDGTKHGPNGRDLPKELEPSYALSIVLLLLLAGAYFFMRLPGKVLMAGVIALVIGHTFYIEKPKELRPEEITMKEVADWYLKNELDEYRTFTCHNFMYYFTGLPLNPKGNSRRLSQENWDQMEDESIIIWESHYARGGSSKRPSIPLDSFSKRPDTYTLMRPQWLSSDNRFQAVVFMKNPKKPIGEYLKNGSSGSNNQ